MNAAGFASAFMVALTLTVPPDKVFDFSLIDEIDRDLDGAHWVP